MSGLSGKPDIGRKRFKKLTYTGRQKLADREKKADDFGSLKLRLQT